MSSSPVAGRPTALGQSGSESPSKPLASNRPLPKPGRRTGRFLGPRIAQRIFLGYILPLAITLALGAVFPVWLWSYLGQAVYDFDERAMMAERAIALQHSAVDSEEHALSFLRYHDKQFEEKFMESRDTFRLRYRDLSDFVDRRQDSVLTQALDNTYKSYNRWLQHSLRAPYRAAQINSRPGMDAESIAHNTNAGFTPVRKALDNLVTTMVQYRDRQQHAARAATIQRRVTSIVIPLGALCLSLLIGRSIALGITRPLESLIEATEQIERSRDSMTLLESDLTGTGPDDIDADDEIGDLQRSFRRMARTIRQREAVLRTQNEAFGSLVRRLEAVLNSTTDGILLIDRAGGFSLVNQRLADLFGLQVEDLLDHTWIQAGPLLLARFRNKQTARDRVRDILDDPESITDETFDTEGPGALRSLRIYSAPVRGSGSGDGDRDELLGRIFVFRDVTRETLVDRMKTEFVSTVSHELRTPLTAIKGYVDLIVSGQTGPLNEVQSEFLTLVQGSTRRLTTLINDMLDISRIESGRMEMRYETVEYVPLIEDAMKMMRQEADARRITLRIEVNGIGAPDGPFPGVLGDADRITQILTNFLSNGIKYTHPGGQVTVKVEFEDNFVTTCVEDTGIGISPEDQRKLFQKFFRADNSTTREAGGTGLGLAITKAILEKMNGSVWVDSEKGRGSRFWFTLPTELEPTESTEPTLELVPGTDTPALLAPANMAIAAGAGTAAAPASKPELHKLVLSVDGDLPLLHRIGHELRRQGYITSNASTVADATRRARDLRPDVITLDLLSPHLDSFAVLEALRKVPSANPRRIALISPIVIGGRMELLDTIEYLPRNASDETLRALLRTALQPPPGSGARNGQQPEETGRHTHAQALLIGSHEMAGHLRAILHSVSPGILLTVAETEDEAERSLGGDWLPGLIVIDTRVMSGRNAGTRMTRFRRRHPDAVRVPVLVLTDEDVCADDVFSLVPLWGGSLPLDDIASAIQTLLDRPVPESSRALAGSAA